MFSTNVENLRFFFSLSVRDIGKMFVLISTHTPYDLGCSATDENGYIQWLSTPELCSEQIYFERNTFEMGKELYVNRAKNGSCQCLNQQWFLTKVNSSGKRDGSKPMEVVKIS